MADLLQKTNRGVLAWGLLIIVLLVMLMGFVFPVLATSADYDQQIESGYKKLQKYRQIASSTPEFMEEYKRVQSQGLDKLFYPQNMTSAQVAKELQKQLATIITKEGGILLSSEVRDDDRSDEEKDSIYQEVRVKAVFHGNPKLLRKLLHQSYRARPLIFVEGLMIKPLKDNDTSEKQMMNGSVEVSTYWRGGGNDEEVN